MLCPCLHCIDISFLTYQLLWPTPTKYYIFSLNGTFRFPFQVFYCKCKYKCIYFIKILRQDCFYVKIGHMPINTLSLLSLTPWWGPQLAGTRPPSCTRLKNRLYTSFTRTLSMTNSATQECWDMRASWISAKSNFSKLNRVQ